MTDLEAKLDRMLELHDAKARMEEELKPVVSELDGLRRDVAREFENRGFDSMRFRNRTLYISRELSVKCKDAQALADAILATGDPGLTAIVTPQPQKLAAAVREMLTDPETGARIVAASRLPEAWRDHIELTEFSRMNIRK